MRGRTIRLMCGLLVLSACGAANDGASAPLTAATPATAPQETAPSSAVESTTASLAPASTTTAASESLAALAARVSATYYQIFDVPGRAIAHDIILNAGAHTVISACVKAAGWQYFPGKLTIAPSQMVSLTGVSPQFWAPPSIRLAEFGGWYGAFDRAAYDAERGFTGVTSLNEQQDDYVAGLTETQRQEFGDVAARCGSEAKMEEDSGVYLLVEELVAGASVIGAATMGDPLFAPIQAKYTSCIRSHGMNFTDPGDEFFRMQNSSEVAEPAYRAAAAIADATCREPLWTEFVDVKRDAWMAWLDDIKPGLVTLAATDAQLLRDAGLG